jgi:hypothetical protein
MINFFRRMFGKTTCRWVKVGPCEYRSECGKNYMLALYEVGVYKDGYPCSCGRRVKVKK